MMRALVNVKEPLPQDSVNKSLIENMQIKLYKDDSTVIFEENLKEETTMKTDEKTQYPFRGDINDTAF